jgi:hypothetical protein
VREGVTLIFGKSWTGKTVRMLHELKTENRVILVDPKCSQLTEVRGWTHLYPPFDFELKVWADDTVSSAFRRVLHSHFRIMFHLRHSHREALELLCRMVMAVKRCTLAIDELGLFVPPGPAGALPPSITAVVVSGTHDGVRVIGTAQRPSLVHATLRANAARMLFYRVTERADQELVQTYLPSGFNVFALPDQVCIDWRDGHDPFIDSDLAGKLGKILPASRS